MFAIVPPAETRDGDPFRAMRLMGQPLHAAHLKVLGRAADRIWSSLRKNPKASRAFNRRVEDEALRWLHLLTLS
jgi:hypothetical protein